MYGVMQETLDYLAKTLVLDTFLEILPGSSKESNDDFKVTFNWAGKISKHIKFKL